VGFSPPFFLWPISLEDRLLRLSNTSHAASVYLLKEIKGRLAIVILQQPRLPWWKWVLLSLSTSLVAVALIVPVIIYLLYQGVDIRDYIELSHPPQIFTANVGAAFALLLAGQSMAPLLVIPLFRPARLLLFARVQQPPAWGMTLKRLGLGVLLFAGVQALWEYVAPPTPERWLFVEHVTYAVVRGGDLWSLLLLVVTAGIFIPIAEELLFRGMLFGWMRQRWGFWVSALLSALSFGLPHGWPNGVPAALFGLYLAYQVERDKSLAGSVLLHTCNNLGALLILMAQLK
jgi:membrane protease YdiL (CAAX protease family)